MKRIENITEIQKDLIEYNLKNIVTGKHEITENRNVFSDSACNTYSIVIVIQDSHIGIHFVYNYNEIEIKFDSMKNVMKKYAQFVKFSKACDKIK